MTTRPRDTRTALDAYMAHHAATRWPALRSSLDGPHWDLVRHFTLGELADRRQLQPASSAARTRWLSARASSS